MSDQQVESERDRELKIPMSERVKISDLKLETEDNPNRMGLAQLDRLKAQSRNGATFQFPIVTKKTC
jgi:hypothetical protein